MNVLDNLRKFAVIAWGALSYALTILPRILSALDALGLTKIKETLVEGIRRGGMEADDYIEENADKILHVALIFDALGDWAYERAQLFRDIHEEGTKDRLSGEEDLLTPAIIADFVKRLLMVDDTADIQKAIEEVTPKLMLAANASIKRDVSAGGPIDC